MQGEDDGPREGGREGGGREGRPDGCPRASWFEGPLPRPVSSAFSPAQSRIPSVGGVEGPPLVFPFRFERAAVVATAERGGREEEGREGGKGRKG